ncbi:protein of unknown function [Nitrospina watsonii]|uniref:Uncharacterized protein n=1 Tax=Nitrospina watsonii TaxID=1323948 RepID=A0ABN8W8I8_9BACT|nr:protein of unknown function [Nitrospina watsonii]
MFNQIRGHKFHSGGEFKRNIKNIKLDMVSGMQKLFYGKWIRRRLKPLFYFWKSPHNFDLFRKPRCSIFLNKANF